MHEPKTSVKDVLLHETCKQKSLEYEEVKQFDKLSKNCCNIYLQQSVQPWQEGEKQPVSNKTHNTQSSAIHIQL